MATITISGDVITVTGTFTEITGKISDDMSDEVVTAKIDRMIAQADFVAPVPPVKNYRGDQDLESALENLGYTVE